MCCFWWKHLGTLGSALAFISCGGPMAATRPQLCNHSDRSGRQSTHPTSRRRLHLAIRRHALFGRQLLGLGNAGQQPQHLSDRCQWPYISATEMAPFGDSSDRPVPARAVRHGHTSITTPAPRAWLPADSTDRHIRNSFTPWPMSNRSSMSYDGGTIK